MGEVVTLKISEQTMRVAREVAAQMHKTAEEILVMWLEWAAAKYDKNPSSTQVPDAIRLLDVVALTTDLPEHNLVRGQVGTIVEILANGKAYEVEFSDRDGRTFESLGLRPDQFMVLHFERMSLPPSLTHAFA